MQNRHIGSVWLVRGQDTPAVVLAGPYPAASEFAEYLVAPLYTGLEPGFKWSSEDVRLEAAETGLGEPRFAAIWNARPILEADLVFQLGTLTTEATITVRDAYWASLNEEPISQDNRLGSPIRSSREEGAQFQVGELERWEPLSGRVIQLRERFTDPDLDRWSFADSVERITWTCKAHGQINVEGTVDAAALVRVRLDTIYDDVLPYLSDLLSFELLEPSKALIHVSASSAPPQVESEEPMNLTWEGSARVETWGGRLSVHLRSGGQVGGIVQGVQ